MITVGIFAKIRRLHLRDKLSIREIARRTNLSRNTIRHWLRQPDMTEPKYPDRHNKSVVDPYVAQLRQWLVADSHRPRRDRRTAKAMFEALKAQGYVGSYTRVAVRAKQLRQELSDAPNRKAFVPLAFAHGEAFQFDWSCEHVFIGGFKLPVLTVMSRIGGPFSEFTASGVSPVPVFVLAAAILYGIWSRFPRHTS